MLEPLAARQFDPERASLADGAADANRTVHRLDEALGQYQSDAGSRHRAALGAEAVERSEQAR